MEEKDIFWKLQNDVLGKEILIRKSDERRWSFIKERIGGLMRGKDTLLKSRNDREVETNCVGRGRISSEQRI